MFKPVSRRPQDFTDYSYISIVAILPSLLGFEGSAVLLCYVFSGTILLSSLYTRSEWGLLRIRSYKEHLVIDFLVGVLALIVTVAVWLLR